MEVFNQTYLSDETWDYFMHNDSNWWVDVDGKWTASEFSIFANLTLSSPQTTMGCAGTLLGLENVRMGSLAEMVLDPIPTMGEPQKPIFLPKTSLFQVH